MVGRIADGGISGSTETVLHGNRHPRFLNLRIEHIGFLPACAVFVENYEVAAFDEELKQCGLGQYHFTAGQYLAMICGGDDAAALLASVACHAGDIVAPLAAGKHKIYFHPRIAGPAFQQMRSHRTLARSSDGKQEADAGKGFQIVVYDGFEILRRTAALAAAAQKAEGERWLHRK